MPGLGSSQGSVAEVGSASSLIWRNDEWQARPAAEPDQVAAASDDLSYAVRHNADDGSWSLYAADAFGNVTLIADYPSRAAAKQAAETRAA